ncbi:DUF1674 domain-containing protein [Xanthobacter pseudotagetidis]|uniref:DUF1674 domain-containing protein n=1 Tax=Xanthobacter pseudotagetidis TaxID=3119911 RepID=UPI003728A95A
MADETSPPPAPPGAAPGKVLSDAAKRALAEAEARRAAIDAAQKERPRELNGRDGPEPVRYGDWEVGGIATDF